MSDRSAIEWTDATWNPIRARNLKTGKVGWYCEHATTGCEFCYAESFNRRLGTALPFKPGHRQDIEIFLDEEMLLAPLRWKRPRKIFVGSMTDLFADFVTDGMLLRIFGVMAHAPHHTFQVLTKRAARLHDFCGQWAVQADSIDPATGGYEICDWPLPNVWLGISCERQQEADERIPHLLEMPAAVRFISAEPLLGPIDLIRTLARWQDNPDRRRGFIGLGKQLLDWVIVGGESGPKARPMNPEWARSLRDQCNVAGVAFFFKQFGEFSPNVLGINDSYPPSRVGKKAAGRLLDGREHNEFPQVRA